MKDAIKGMGKLLASKAGLSILGLFGGTMALALLIAFIFVALFIAILGGGSANEQEVYRSQNSGGSNANYSCSPTGEIKKEVWDFQWDKMGVVKDEGDTVLEISKELGLDPVLFASIMAFETGWGTSPALVNFKNPGGLMDPSSTNSVKLYEYDTYEEGIRSMSNTLYNRIIRDGLVTIEKLGPIYAPVGAVNDPNGLNNNWIPSITSISQQFGGLTMNCTPSGDVELIGDKAWVVPETKRITSYFGNRSCAGCSKNHRGIDISKGAGKSYGLTTVSLMDGVVTTAIKGCVEGYRSCGGGFGNHVIVDHGNGVSTLYAHFQKSNVDVGQKVEKGQVLGLIGNTGSSGGAHLHFEIRINGNRVDPLPHIEEFLGGN